MICLISEFTHYYKIFGTAAYRKLYVASNDVPNEVLWMNLIKAKVIDNTHLELEKEIGIPEKDVLIKIIRWGVVESAEGAWGYDVNSKDFVEDLRKSKRLDWI